MKAERERTRTQMKDLELQLSEMHDELDREKKAELIDRDKDALMKVNEALQAASAASKSGRDVALCPSGCGAAARRLPGDAAAEGGARGAASPKGEGAGVPEGSAEGGGGDPRPVHGCSEGGI